MIVTQGSIDVSVPFYFVDDVGGTNPGEPTTGLLFSNIETGGSASYQRQGAARVDFTLVTQTAAGAHTDGGFVLVDDTNMKGVYRCDVPDAAFASGVDFVIIYLNAASGSNTVARPLKIDLTAVDLRDAVRGGMTALPNAAADAAGGLAVSDAGGNDLDAMNAAAIRLTAVRAATLTDWINGGRLDSILDARASQTSVNTVGSNVVLVLADTGTTIPSQLTTMESNLTSTIQSVNSGAARYIAIITPSGYEIPDSGNVTMPIEIRCFDGDGEPVDLDAAADPTVAIYRASDATNLSAALSAITNPATGVWRLTYTVEFDDAVEPLRIDASGTIATTARTTSAYPVVTDAVAVDFTSADRAKLTTCYTDHNTGSLAVMLSAFDSATSGRNEFPVDFDLVSVDQTGVRVYDIVADALGSIEARVDTALGTYDGPTNAEMVAAFTQIKGATWATTDTLEQIRDNVGGGGGGGDATLANQAIILAKMLAYFRLLMRSDAAAAADAATELTAINASGGSGSGNYDTATDSQEATRDKVDTITASALTGDYTRTITIDDGTDPIENAKVRIYRTGETETQLTDANGQVSFAVDAATWTVAVTATGFDGQANTLVVSADGSTTYTMVASSGTGTDVGWIG